MAPIYLSRDRAVGCVAGSGWSLTAVKANTMSAGEGFNGPSLSPKIHGRHSQDSMCLPAPYRAIPRPVARLDRAPTKDRVA